MAQLYYTPDLVALNGNVTTVDPHSVKDIPVEMTVVGGKAVYEA